MAEIKWDDIAAGGLGAVDELLLGAPEWLLKNLGAREQVEDYIKAHEKAFRTGETIGTVGGALIPVGTLARGAKTALGIGKAAKALSTGKELATLAEGAGALARPLLGGARAVEAAAPAAKSALGEIARLAGRGAAAGGAEAAARGLFDEENAGQIAQDIGQGTLFGGLGGAAGGILSKSLSPALDKLQEFTAQQYLKGRGINSRALRRAFNESMPRGAKENYKVQRAGEYLRDVADFTKKIPRREGSVERLAAETDKAYGALNDAFKGAYGHIPAPKMLDTLIDHIDFSKISEDYGPEAAEQARKMLVSQATGKAGLVQLKGFLQNAFDQSRTNPKISENWALSGAMQDIAKTLKGNLDDIAVKLMEREGKAPINIAAVNKAYKLGKPLKIAEIADTLSPGAVGGGSPTFDKASVSRLLGQVGIGAGIGGATDIAGAAGIDTGSEVANRALSSVLGAVGAKALSSGASRLIGAVDTPIAKLAAKVTPEVAEKMAPDLAIMGGRAGADIAKQATVAAQPTTEGEAQAASAGAEAGQAQGTPQYTSLIMGKLNEYATANGIEPGSQDYKDFVQVVASATISPEGQPFDPRKMAKLLYPDPEQRAKYLKALDVSQRLSSSLAPAVKSKGGVFGIGEDVAQRIERETALGKLETLVNELSKGTTTEKRAKANLAAILNANLSQAKKKELIMNMLSMMGVDFDTLAQAGLANV